MTLVHQSMRRALPMIFAGGLGLCGFAALAISLPLATYTVSLAAFGLPHVLSELRYVDRRFGRRIARQILIAVAILLPAIVAIRSLVVFHQIQASIGVPAELAGVAVLALICARGSYAQICLAVSVAAALGCATVASPFTTAISLSILHNLTPLGFLWQIAPRAERARIMSVALAAFVGLPLLVATGLPREALTGLMGILPALDPLQAGPLDAHLYVYVPPQFVATPAAVDLFTASVVAQGAHYVAVIFVLPLLLARFDAKARGLAPWPKTMWFTAMCGIVALMGLARFFAGFADARALYGIFASVHAWIEIPVLIVALTGASYDASQDVSQSPTSTDMVLAMSETSNARSMRNAAIQAISKPSTTTTADSSATTVSQ
jgi:hypothetical protein